MADQRLARTSRAGALESVHERLEQRTRHYVEQGRSENTRRAYEGAWRRFGAWCVRLEVPAFPADPGTVAKYLGWMADQGKSVSTIEKARAAIRKFHELQHVDTPTKHPIVNETVNGIKRVKGVRPNQRRPLLLDELEKVLSYQPVGLLGLRNKAMLTFGFAAALRRHEIADTDVEHLRFLDRRDGESGVELSIAKSKTDQTGAGERLWLPRLNRESVCPVRHLEHWLQDAEIEKGPVFRPFIHGKMQPQRITPQAVNRTVKAAVKRAGLDPSEFGGHSLRSGYVTSMDMAGIPESHIRRITRHKSGDMVRRYMITTDITDNPTRKVLDGLYEED